MILLLLSIITFILLLIYFYTYEVRASVFPRLGFISDEINLDKVNFAKHYAFKIYRKEADYDETNKKTYGTKESFKT